MSGFALYALLAVLPTGAARYDGHRVVRAYPADQAALVTVIDLADAVWSERPRPGRVDVALGPEAMAALDASGIDYDVLVSDVQIAIDDEQERLAARPEPTAATWYDDFRTFAEIDAQLDALAQVHDDVVDVYTVGGSLEGRTVRGIKLGRAAEGKSAMLLTGTMHAREWLSPMTVMCIADRLLADADNDPSLLETIDVLVIPVLNPDGYVYSWEGDRYWRKNTRGGYGVDLNRNFGYAWGGEGASPYPEDENYAGDAAFSEPETQILRDFMQAHPELVSHIDFHSYAEFVIYPWGYGYDTAPDEPLLSSLAGSMASALNATHGSGFQPIQGADFYPAAGAVDDWAYGSQGLMAFTIELRGNDFVIAPSNIAPSCDESLAAVMELAAWTVEQSHAEPPVDDGGSEGTGDASAGEDGSGGGASEGGDASSAGGDASSDDAGDESNDDDDDGSSGTDPFLPGAYGMGPTDSCACTTNSPRAGAWLFVVLVALARRRRSAHGTK